MVQITCQCGHRDRFQRFIPVGREDWIYYDRKAGVWIRQPMYRCPSCRTEWTVRAVGGEVRIEAQLGLTFSVKPPAGAPLAGLRVGQEVKG